MEESGMTDLQFKDHLRGLIYALEDVRDEQDVEKKDEKIQKFIDRLSKTLED